jgi:hypothetical protein
VVRAEDLRVLEEFPSLCAAGFRVLSGSPELLEQLKGLVHEVAAERPWREAVCQARLDLLGYELARQMEKGPCPTGNGKTLHPAALRATPLDPGKIPSFSLDGTAQILSGNLFHTANSMILSFCPWQETSTPASNHSSIAS